MAHPLLALPPCMESSPYGLNSRICRQAGQYHSGMDTDNPSRCGSFSMRSCLPLGFRSFLLYTTFMFCLWVKVRYFDSTRRMLSTPLIGFADFVCCLIIFVACKMEILLRFLTSRTIRCFFLQRVFHYALPFSVTAVFKTNICAKTLHCDRPVNVLNETIWSVL